MQSDTPHTPSRLVTLWVKVPQEIADWLDDRRRPTVTSRSNQVRVELAIRMRQEHERDEERARR